MASGIKSGSKADGLHIGFHKNSLMWLPNKKNVHICEMKHYSFPLSGFEAIKLEILGRANKMNARKKRRMDEIQRQRRTARWFGEIEQNEIQSDRLNNWIGFEFHNKFVKETAMLLIDLIFSCVLANKKFSGKNKTLCSIHHRSVDILPAMVYRVILVYFDRHWCPANAPKFSSKQFWTFLYIPLCIFNG